MRLLETHFTAVPLQFVNFFIRIGPPLSISSQLSNRNKWTDLS